MKNHLGATAGCHLIGEYLDEGEIPAGVAVSRGEVERPRLAADHLDLWGESPHFAGSLSSAVLQVIEHEPHGPSRAQMVESLAKLEAVAAIREVIRRSETGVPTQALITLGRIFTPEEHREDIPLLLSDLLRSFRRGNE